MQNLTFPTLLQKLPSSRRFLPLLLWMLRCHHQNQRRTTNGSKGLKGVKTELIFFETGGRRNFPGGVFSLRKQRKMFWNLSNFSMRNCMYFGSIFLIFFCDFMYFHTFVALVANYALFTYFFWLQKLQLQIFYDKYRACVNMYSSSHLKWHFNSVRKWSPRNLWIIW